ncbi:hypothetical protein D047_3054B, partial [Vibrio parahaemolyticus VPTS-2010_2]
NSMNVQFNILHGLSYKLRIF